MNTTIEKALNSKLRQIKQQAEDLIETLQKTVNKIDEQGISTALGNEIDPRKFQELLIEFRTMKDFYENQKNEE